MKKVLLLLSILVLIGVVVFSLSYKDVVTNTTVTKNDFDAKNSAFIIENTRVLLIDGYSKNSQTNTTTRYFGNEATGDLNNDGQPDKAFLVVQDGGGSGIFFYVVAALKTSTGYKTTNAFFVGDRIAPQNTEISNNELRVNFAERGEGEPMTTQPSQGATLMLKVTPDGVLEGLMK